MTSYDHIDFLTELDLNHYVSIWTQSTQPWDNEARSYSGET